MKIAILIYPNCSIWSATGSFELLQRANKAQEYYYGGKNNHKKFEIEFVSSQKLEVQTSVPFSIQIETTIYDKKEYDLILIPGFFANSGQVLNETKDVVEWIKDNHQKKVTIAGICSGVLLLALSGLIKGRTATAHWLMKDFFEDLFPDIELDFSRLVIDYGDILMSGSATSFQNLIIYIIEKYMGRTVAVGVSKIYLIDMNRDRPDSYMDLVAGKKHNDKEIIHAQEFIKKNYKCKLSLDEIAEKVSLTRRTFIRRFRKATNETPLSYIHKVKVEKAKQLLENERITFAEIAFMLGYEDVNVFRKIFVKQTGISPMKYKARYQMVDL